MSSGSQTPSVSVSMSISMTTATATTTTTANMSSGTSMGGNGGGNDSGISTTSSSLYLFTFLGTLLLLLAVSCAIVARSFVLRRRFRRRMEEAIAAGIMLPPAGDRRRNFGEKPKMFEAWLAPGYNESWRDIMPVSLRLLPPPKRARARPATGMNGDDEDESTTFFGRTRNYMSFGGPFHRSRRAAPSSPSPGSPSAEDEVVQKRMQVAVMVAMPDPARPHYNPLHEYTPGVTMPTPKGKQRGSYDADWDEDELPPVLMGVAELPYAPRKSTGGDEMPGKTAPSVASSS